MNHSYLVEKTEKIIVSGTLLLKLLREAKLVPPAGDDDDEPQGELRITMTLPVDSVVKVGEVLIYDGELPETALHFLTKTTESKNLSL